MTKRKKRKRRIPWSERELSILKMQRDKGISVPDIVANPKVLKRRTKDSIVQQLKRQGWVDKEASERSRNRETLSPEAHTAFVGFLRAHSGEPFERLVSSWNEWAEARSWAKIAPSTIQYWLNKLKLPHSRKAVLDSEYSKDKRKRKRDAQYDEMHQKLERRIAIALEATAQKSESVAASQRKLETCACGLCGNKWPLTTAFFNYLPNSFSYGGNRLKLFQIEYCRFCYRTDDWRLAFFNAWNLSTTLLRETRKAQRRKGLDRAWENCIDRFRHQRDQLVARNRFCTQKQCVRCRELWPEKEPYYHANPARSNGSASFRSLCAFCDDWYLRTIDRRTRDGLDSRELKAERYEYLVQGGICRPRKRA
jgi:hypothetical protein